MKVDLHDRVALVTGAAQGIGRAVADTLAPNDARDSLGLMATFPPNP